MKEKNDFLWIEVISVGILFIIIFAVVFLFSQVVQAQESPSYYSVDTLLIDGENFPLNQFFVAGEQRCPDQHYHPVFGTVYSLNNVQRNDPNPTECGFGIVSELSKVTVIITKEQLDAYQGFGLANVVSDATAEQFQQFQNAQTKKPATSQAGSAGALSIIASNEAEIKTSLVVLAPLIIISSASLLGYVPYIPRLLMHFFTWLVGLFGKKKKSRIFGIAYDSITKRPLKLAIIRLFKDSKLVATQVTDMKGRYHFLLEAGKYELEGKKPEYVFPSSVVKGKSDGEYENIYQGSLEAMGGKAKTPDLPLDPKNYSESWQSGSLLKKLWLALQKAGRYAAMPLLVIGFVFGLLLLLSQPQDWSNWLITLIYLLLFVLQFSVSQPLERAWGVVYNITNNMVLPLTTVQLIETQYNKIVASRLSDYAGRFSFLPEPGTYVIKADKSGFKQAGSAGMKAAAGLNPVKAEIKIDKSGQHIKGDVLMEKI